MPLLLVVDDSAMDRRLVGGILEKNPQWNVIYATNGKEAMAEVERHIPDLVLTDMQMPVMNGFELVNAVKDEYPLIPVVLMTAQGSEEIAVQALKQGAASYVPKRRLALELREIVERVLSASDVDRSESRLMHRVSQHRTTFVLETDSTLVPSVVNYIQQVMTRMRFCDDTDCLRVGVALEEALLNSYYHGNLEISSELRESDHNAYYQLSRERAHESPYRDRRIHVEAVMTPGECRFVIRDEGPGFDPTTLPDATDPANLERPCGRGLLLMRTFMDEVRFNDVGNEVTLIKRRRPGHTPAEDLEGGGSHE
jgi:CheY-like chemotaxis protein/anti-sigma regulatory factor (Ser/Thr protein kinase)